MAFFILFDGGCGLCHRSVRFTLKHDTKSKFIFLSNLSEKGKKMLSDYHLEHESARTLIAIDDQRQVYLRGKAVVLILQNLPKYRWIGRCLDFMPLVLLNLVYRLVAKYRRKLGLKTCLMPTPEQADRILL